MEHKVKNGMVILAFFKGLLGLGVAMTMALHQILGIQRWHSQEERESQNQAFSLSLAWSISSGHMLSGPGDLPVSQSQITPSLRSTLYYLAE